MRANPNQPFDPALNRVILELAPRHVARPSVPLFDAATPHERLAQLQTPSGLLVWDGASDATIYADARVNHAFRAWHDACHIAAGVGFTLSAERAACEAQLRSLLLAYPRAPRHWVQLIRAEIIGQAEHFATHGTFPVDQFAFVKGYTQ